MIERINFFYQTLFLIIQRLITGNGADSAYLIEPLQDETTFVNAMIEVWRRLELVRGVLPPAWAAQTALIHNRALPRRSMLATLIYDQDCSQFPESSCI